MLATDLNINRSANLVIEQHGARAQHYALEQAEHFKEGGDIGGEVVWRKIARVCESVAH